ncbi:hypothetical protein SDC9_196817 [bioreactor metagenome]|uniref:DUF2992 domain-containing protein n=1 Tax=bioreactor metagenome TaxID=1076179 RepID=A0A645IED5_9ZZZZ
MLKNWHKLVFSPAIDAERAEEKRINPKRLQRVINRQIQTLGIGTKAQQALKLQHEKGKADRKIHTRKKREDEKIRQFELRQEKRKEKHRGH